MATTAFKSPLHETVSTTATDYWNDSCSIEELTYAIEHGAVGATSNPTIVGEVLAKELDLWRDRIAAIVAGHPSWTEDEVTWQLIELSGGDTGYSFDRSVDILVSRLRRKMEDDPKTPKLILTVRSGGYQFLPETTSE